MVVQILFFIVAALIIGAAMMVISVRNIIHSALWLITTFLGIGMLYLLLEAEFLAVAQVLIYIGAVSVLVLFAIMFTPNISRMGEDLYFKRWWLTLLIVGVLFAVILVPTLYNQSWNTAPLPTDGTISGPVEIGTAFVQEFFLPFQVAAVLLLVALVGAVVVTLEVRTVRRVLTLAEEIALRRQQDQHAAINGVRPAESIEATVDSDQQAR
ncbi:MAG: NADH-quinone oxidoreductase subunit J [Chloroflexaceae bacterium]|nr:NADH-quinone oxidoreductase subunit J [Chloroflexaceae bacterium]NJL34890.1 NADH-quinone oxidoreductase subunit J [Chloroflexaceae bacterium]